MMFDDIPIRELQVRADKSLCYVVTSENDDVVKVNLDDI